MKNVEEKLVDSLLLQLEDFLKKSFSGVLHFCISGFS
jgi:hypothetical protein